MRRPRDYAAYAVDIEGVLVRDKRYLPIEGSVEWFNGLAGRGIDRCLVSNNTTHRPAELIADLRGAGFEVAESDLITATSLGLRLLARREAWRVLWLGSDHLAGWWREEGFELVRDGPCDAVVLGVDPDLVLRDLEAAVPALLDHGALLVTLHRSPFYLDARGLRRPGPGAWAAALEAVAGRKALCVGKPSRRIYREALKKLGREAAEVLFISDDPVGDLVTAGRLGMGTAFVLSGKNPDHGILARLDQRDWPDVICERPADLERR